MDLCAAMYVGRPNDDVFETFLNSFRSVNSTALLQVYSDLGKKESTELAKKYDVNFKTLKDGDYKGKRCLCKMRCVEAALDTIGWHDRLMFCDVDIYCLANPFEVFPRAFGFEIGVTSRISSYRWPINSGVFFVVKTPRTEEVFGSEFEKYAAEHFNTQDWFIDQDYLNKLYQEKKARDVGWQYNFCPNTDVFGIKLATDMIRRAYQSRSVKILHLKSELKLCIYDGFLEHAVTTNPSGVWNWAQCDKE